MSRPTQRKRTKANTRLVRVEAGREALWWTKEARSPQPAKIVADSSLDYFFFSLLVCDPVQQPNGGQYVLDTTEMAGSRKTASTNKY